MCMWVYVCAGGGGGGCGRAGGWVDVGGGMSGWMGVDRWGFGRVNVVVGVGGWGWG